MSDRAKRILATLPLHLVVIAIAIVWLVPTIGLLVSSLRTPQAIRSTGWWTVFDDLFSGEQWTLQNYDVVLNTQGLAQAFRNSLYVTIPGTLLPIAVAASAAFALAWMEFRGRQTIFVTIIVLIVVPLQVTFIPVFRMFNRLGIIDLLLSRGAALDARDRDGLTAERAAEIRGAYEATAHLARRGSGQTAPG